MSLLIRLYDPKEGRVLIDNTDVRKLKLTSLRDQFSVVLQEPLLFQGTIKENIRYGQLDATEEEVINAATAANAHDFISNLPKGYETQLGERGAQISLGERQRVCVARAFLRDAPILILDEPTSSIDSKTEKVILDALDELVKGRTSFIVAHRLSTVRDADRILVMDRGRIVEQGTHEELLAQRGLYRTLHAAQIRELGQRPVRRGGAARTLDGDGAGPRRDGSGTPAPGRHAPREVAVRWRQVSGGGDSEEPRPRGAPQRRRRRDGRGPGTA
jgi:ABC-type multidrug transport system fused ATPase/permease subunit